MFVSCLDCVLTVLSTTFFNEEGRGVYSAMKEEG